MSRISPFPDFLMDWVTRQVEEIVTKLTDFPTLYIILPDFTGLMDLSWGNIPGDFMAAYEKGKTDYKRDQ